MGRIKKAKQEETPSDHIRQRLQHNKAKTSSKTLATDLKPSRTKKIKGSAHQDFQKVAVKGGRKSKWELQAITVLQEKRKLASLKKTTKASLKVKDDQNSSGVGIKMTRKTKLPTSRPKETRIPDGVGASSECILEVDPSSGDIELTNSVESTLHHRHKESVSEAAFKSGGASVQDSPCITIVELGPGFRSGTQQVVSLPIAVGHGDKRKLPKSSTRSTSEVSYLGKFADRTFINPLNDANDVDKKFGNPLPSKKLSPAEGKSLQGVFVVDLGSRMTRETISIGKSAKLPSTKGSSPSKDNLALKQLQGDSKRKEHYSVEGESDLLTSTKEAVKNRSKKRKLSAGKRMKGENQSGIKALRNGDKIEKEEEASKISEKKKSKKIKKSSGRMPIEKSKEEYEELRKTGRLGNGEESNDQEVQSSTLVQKTRTRKTKRRRKKREVTDAQRRCEEMGQPSKEENKDALVPIRGDTGLSLKDPVRTSPDDNETPSKPELDATIEDNKVSSDSNAASSWSPFAEIADEMDVFQDAIRHPSYRVVKLQNSDQCLVLLPHQSQLGFHGRVLVRAIHGSVRVMGFPILATADRRYHPLYSPNSSCALCFETLVKVGGNSTSLVQDVDAFLGEEGETAIAEALDSAVLGNADIALVVKRMPVDSAVDYVERFPGFSNLFRSPDRKECTRKDVAWMSNLKAAAAVGLQPITTTTPGTVFTTLPGYQSVVQAIQRWVSHAAGVAPVVLICGWKNVGKSTLCRYLSNSLIASAESLCYLECDMAQTEFTPPGMLSLQRITKPLLGPPFTHSRKAEKMCFYGDVNVRADPESYLRMIKHLVKEYQTNFRQLPLIINTMGWMQGIGLQLLVDIIHMTHPSHVVQLWSRSQPRTIPKITEEFLEQTSGWMYRPYEWSDVEKTSFPEVLDVDVPNISDQGSTKYKASDHRTMALLASLSSLQPSPLPLLPVALSALTPLVLPWKQVAVHVTNSHVTLRQVMYALNGSIVGLCQANPSEMHFVSEDHPKIFRSPPVCQCHGLGVIRGIDPIQKVFYILTGVAKDALREVNALVKGALALPQPLLTQGHRVEDVPYVSREFSSVIIGSGAIKVRRNIKQRGR